MAIAKVIGKSVSSLSRIQGLTPPVDSATKILWHCDGTNGSTSFPDSSGNGNNASVLGNTQVTTSVKYFGTGSCYVDGVGDRLYVTTSDLAVGTGDYTIEFWCRFPVLPGTYNTFMQHGPYYYTHYANNPPTQLWINYVGQGAYFTQSYAFSLNTWYHHAFSRSSGTMRVFINGVQLGPNSSHTYNYTENYIYMGLDGTTGQPWKGWIDEFRFSNVARYTSNFSLKTAPYGQISKIAGV